MTHLAKLIFYLLRELIFDNKDEYNHKSVKFNTRKFLILILFTLSFLTNFWVFNRFLIVANEHIELQEQVEKRCPYLLKKPEPNVDKKDTAGTIR